MFVMPKKVLQFSGVIDVNFIMRIEQVLAELDMRVIEDYVIIIIYTKR